MRQIGVKPKSLLEPFGRNTAPATTLAALLAKDMNRPYFIGSLVRSYY